MVNYKKSGFDITRKKVMDCEYRQAYHIMPPLGWMNDPNGLVFYKGEYHVFYQYNPFDSKWGSIHWGHYKSKDLVHWTELPVALAPDATYDRDGCFSGSAIVAGDELKLFYTGNIFTGPNNDEDLLQTQCMASSHDGIHFRKYEANPLLPNIPGIKHFRDPFVWQKNGLFYMVLGTQTDDRLRGRAVLYQSDDLLQWSYVGCVSESDGSLGYMWECPSIFELNGRDVLIVSPQGMDKAGEHYNNLHQSGYTVGKLNYETAELAHGEFIELDRGFDFYAPQTFMDDKGRRILIAWMDMWDSYMPTQENHWAGTMTLPREIHLNKDGWLYYKPVEELKQLRYNPVEIHSISINGEEHIKGIQGKCIELLMEFNVVKTQSDLFGVALRTNKDHSEETVIAYNKNKNQLILDRNKSGTGPKGIRKITFNEPVDQLCLHIFIDHSSIEIFVNEGEYVMSARIYPQKDADAIYFFGQEVHIDKLHKWDLKKVMD